MTSGKYSKTLSNVEYRRQYYLAHRDKIQAANARWMRNNLSRYHAYKKEWAIANRERVIGYHQKYRFRIKLTVLRHYGSRCACCGETEVCFLSVDHVNGGGNKHRKLLGRKALGIRFYRWLIDNHFPDGFQILCFNCNLGKSVNRGVCPHEDIDDVERSLKPLLRHAA